MMEIKIEYLNRREKEIKNRINMIKQYIETNSTPTQSENGVGSSYIRRRNSRLRINQQYRIDEFKNELKSLERKLKDIEFEKNQL